MAIKAIAHDINAEGAHMSRYHINSNRQLHRDSVLIGEIIAGRYRVDSEIGVGGMGCVYRAHTLGAPPRHVAIKVLRPQVSHIERYGQRFAAEVRVTSSLVHPNIVGVDDHGYLPDGRQYLVLELLVGQSLAEVMQRCDHLKWDRALRIARDLARALEVVHAQDVVHRDIKPENIFLQPVMGREQVKLMDFGLAKQLRESIESPFEDLSGQDLTEPGFAIGTPTYMAPERVTGDYDCRSDLYALCVVLYEMVSGRPPFLGDPEEVLRKHMLREPLPVTQVNPRAKIPRPVEQLLQKGLSKNVGARFQSARELVEELSIALAGENDPTVAMSKSPRWSWKRRLRHWYTTTLARPRVRKGALIGGGVLALIILIAVSAGGHGSASAEDFVAMSGTSAESQGSQPSASKESEVQAVQEPSAEDDVEADVPADALAELQAAKRSWEERALPLQGFAVRRNTENTPCGKAKVDGVSLMLCVYDGERSAQLAREHALKVLDSETNVALASGRSLLLIADDGRDPEGRTVQSLVEGFLARNE
jgi:serine/threonine-protein kinase